MKKDPKNISFEIDFTRYSIKKNIKYVLLTSISFIVFSILYYLFVVNLGTILDHILSLVILSYIAIVWSKKTYCLIENKSTLKRLKKEYVICTETKEQKIIRERKEKLNRIKKSKSIYETIKEIF